MVPTGAAPAPPPAKPAVSALANHPRHGPGERVAQSVGRAVAGPHSIGGLLDRTLPFQVQRPEHGLYRREFTGDLPTETQKLEPLAHQHRPVDCREGCYEVRQL